MKSYKQLKRQLNESEYMDGGALGQWPVPDSVRSAYSDFGVHRIEYDHELQRIQAFLHGFTKREYLDPRAALSLMRLKLKLAGLDFDLNSKTKIGVGYPIYLTLKRWGGTFGVTPHNDGSKGFVVTDGISDILGGDHLALAIVINEAESGLYKMDCKIVRYKDSPEQGVIQKGRSLE